MRKRFPTDRISRRLTLVSVVLLSGALAAGCAHRRVDQDEPVSPDTTRDQKIENLSSALSRAQSRIEELDAKLSALSDKVDSTRLAVDNLAGTKPLKTEAVGSAQESSDTDTEEPAKPTASKHERSVNPDQAISEFNKAMSFFKAGKYSDAELAFNHFTETYPEHILAGSAQFYAGESYFMMGEYKLAINEYQKVIASFKSSPRVSSALVRMAQCYQAIGDKAESSRTMALAHDLFEGNPSLDWNSPSAASTSAAPAQQKTTKSELNAEPIEPGAVKTKPGVSANGQEGHQNNAPSADDDKHIDDIDGGNAVKH